jgi:hypothetical protein
MGSGLRVKVPPGGGGANRSHRQGLRREAGFEGSPLRQTPAPRNTNHLRGGTARMSRPSLRSRARPERHRVSRRETGPAPEQRGSRTGPSRPPRFRNTLSSVGFLKTLAGKRLADLQERGYKVLVDRDKLALGLLMPRLKPRASKNRPKERSREFRLRGKRSVRTWLSVFG